MMMAVYNWQTATTSSTTSSSTVLQRCTMPPLPDPYFHGSDSLKFVLLPTNTLAMSRNSSKSIVPLSSLSYCNMTTQNVHMLMTLTPTPWPKGGGGGETEANAACACKVSRIHPAPVDKGQ